MIFNLATVFQTWRPVPVGRPSTKFQDAVDVIDGEVDFASWQSRGMTCHLGEANRAGVAEINDWVNANITYTSDATDNWQTPSDTLSYSQGDCEDFAILKRAILIERGFSNEDVIMVAGTDMYQHVDHAVLLVYNENQWLLLDNRTNVMSYAQTYADFLPIKGYADGNTWIFGHAV